MLTPWFQWQIDYLLILQNMRDITNHVFDNFFLSITVFGEITIPIIFLLLMYWCIDKKIGKYLIFNFIFGFLTNMFLKITACIYRPWVLSSDIHPVEKAIPAAQGYSFPSGHTANAMSVWGGCVLAFWKNKWIRFSAMALTLLIMFSRNYLGVHTPQDVIVSFVIGLGLIFGVYKLLQWEEKTKNGDIIICSIVTILSVALLIYSYMKSYPVIDINGNTIMDISILKTYAFDKVGLVLGMMFGFCLESRFINFNEKQGGIITKIIRFIIGFAIINLLFYLTKHCLVQVIDKKIALLIGYMFTGLFVTYFYPLILTKLKR